MNETASLIQGLGALPKAIEQWQARSVYASQRPDLYRSLAWVYNGEVRPGQLVDVLAIQVRRLEERRSPMAYAMAQAVDSLRNGVPLARAMRHLAPPADVMTMSAFQQRDALGAMFSTLARVAQNQREMRQRMSVMMAPVGYFILLVVMMGLFAYLLLPVLQEASPIERWPTYARLFGYLSEFIAQHGPLLGTALIAFIGLYAWSLPNWSGTVRTWLDGTSLYSWYREQQAADLLSSLSAQFDGGVKFLPALRNLRDYANPYLAHHIDQIEERAALEFANNPLGALRVPLLHEETVDAIELLRAGGNDPAPVINQLGQDAYSNAARRLESVARNAGRVLLVITGLMLAWAFGAMTAPLAEGVGQATSTNQSVVK